MLVYRIIQIVFTIYYVMIIANIFMRWRLATGEHNFASIWVFRLTEPYLNIFRKLMPPKKGSKFDFSPLLAIIVLMIIELLLEKAWLWAFVKFFSA